MNHPEPSTRIERINFAEFFAGIGLIRAALEPLGFNVAWANDIDNAKRDQYAANHSTRDFVLADVRSIRGQQIPQDVELATSSFPCVDVSLAGNRRGLAGKHSSMFWEFARILAELRDKNRPRMILLENVTGFVSSNSGHDLRNALVQLNELGYSCDIFAINARHFVPQSRPRMFIIGLLSELPAGTFSGIPPVSPVRPLWIQAAYVKNRDLNLHYLPLPALPKGPTNLSTVIEPMEVDDPRWWDSDRVRAFIDSLSAIQVKRFEALQTRHDMTRRTAYRRTRHGYAVGDA
jgi:DNA (cytosine-5)-methyltransferase 1